MIAGYRKAKAEGLFTHREYSLEERALRAERMRNRAVSDESRKKMSEAKKGKPLSEEHRRKIGESNKGRIVSDETKLKISEKAKLRGPAATLKGREASLEWRKNLGYTFRSTCKLNHEKVYKIKKLLSEGLSLNKIAKRFDVSKKLILLIKQGKIWKDVEYK